MNYFLDFDANPSDRQAVLNLVQTAYDMAEAHQGVRDAQCERDYQNFHAFVDMGVRDPDRFNVAIPKLYSILMARIPKVVRAAIGARPYIPLTTERKEYKEVVKIYQRGLDVLLARAGFRNNFILCGLMAGLYGTSYLEILPYYEDDTKKVIVPETIPAADGSEVVLGYHIEEIPFKRLHFQITPYAIWEVKNDPFATNLENRQGSRFQIKIQIVSKRELKRLARMGAYGEGFDVDALDEKMPDYTQVSQHRGLQILQNMGIPEPEVDGDIGVLFRYESPDRYIDVWNDQTVVRAISNPYKEVAGTYPVRRGHGLINTSRMIHNIDPHTQTRFYGQGEGKISEPLTTALNDHVGLTFDNANFTNQSMTFAMDDGRLKKEDLVHQVGNKIIMRPIPGVNSIRDMIMIAEGGKISPDFYALRAVLEDYINTTHRSFGQDIGKPAEGRHTLGEIVMLDQAGDAGDEMSVSLIEDPFLTDVGTKCLAHMEQFAKSDDWADLVGEEEASELIVAHPRDLPGRFDFGFQGSDKVMNQLIQQRNLREIYKPLVESPYAKRRQLDSLLLSKHDMADEIEELLYTEEEAAALQQQQLEQEMQMESVKADNETRRKVAQKEAESRISTRAKIAESTAAQPEVNELEKSGREAVAL